MMLENFSWYAGAFLLAIAVLVVVHELGHYFAARACGVKVLRFAFGFGPVIWSYKKKPNDTEWAVAAFPLGGYVKMLDEREGDVVPGDLHCAFNRQSIARRSFIVAAGPVANLALAVLIYWILFMHGVDELKPRLGQPPVNTPAALVGIIDGVTVKNLNGKAIDTWQDFRWSVLQEAMDGWPLRLEVLTRDREIKTYEVDLGGLSLEDLEKDPLTPLGLVLFRPRLPAVVGRIAVNSVAERSGFMIEDRVVAIAGQSVTDWSQLATTVRKSAGQSLSFDVLRNGRRLSIEATPSAIDEGATKIGRLGMMAKEGVGEEFEMMTVVKYGPVQSAWRAITQTWDTSILSLRMMGRMLMGQLSLKNISGPVTIADYAGQSAKMGFSYYFRFLALISISLGVLNLLPIPVLDGGHLMYYLVEFVKRGPVSERTMEIGQQIGFALLALLMVFAFYNDFNRLVSG